MDTSSLIDSFVKSAAASAALFGLGTILSFVCLGSALIGLTYFGAKLFNLSNALQMPQVVVAFLARVAGAAILLFGLGPLVFSLILNSNILIQIFVSVFVVFVLPPLVYAKCLEIVTPILRYGKNASYSLALFAEGAWGVIIALITLLLNTSLNVNGVAAVAGATEQANALNNALWIFLFLSALMCGLGYYLGTNLSPLDIENPDAERELPRELQVPTFPPPQPPAPVQKWLMVAGQQVVLQPGDHKIGRTASCFVRIDDQEISREHAILRIHEDRVLLGDLSSRNGTFVNGMPVQQERVLQKGDKIRVGNTTLEYFER